MNIFARQNGWTNILNRLLIRFQIWILCTFECPELGHGNFTLSSGSNIVTTSNTAENSALSGSNNVTISQHKIRFALFLKLFLVTVTNKNTGKFNLLLSIMNRYRVLNHPKWRIRNLSTTYGRPKLNLARFLMDNSIQIMTTTALDVHLYNLRTYRYTPVSHGEPPSHGATVYGKIPPTYNNSNVQQSCVTVSQPLQEVATNVHSVQLSTADNTFHIYGICLNRNRMIELPNTYYGKTLTLPKWEVG